MSTPAYYSADDLMVAVLINRSQIWLQTLEKVIARRALGHAFQNQLPADYLSFDRRGTQRRNHASSGGNACQLASVRMTCCVPPPSKSCGAYFTDAGALIT
jgi:hypothetical protein